MRIVFGFFFMVMLSGCDKAQTEQERAQRVAALEWDIQLSKYDENTLDNICRAALHKRFGPDVHAAPDYANGLHRHTYYLAGRAVHCFFDPRTARATIETE